MSSIQPLPLRNLRNMFQTLFQTHTPSPEANCISSAGNITFPKYTVALSFLPWAPSGWLFYCWYVWPNLGYSGSLSASSWGAGGSSGTNRLFARRPPQNKPYDHWRETRVSINTRSNMFHNTLTSCPNSYRRSRQHSLLSCMSDMCCVSRDPDFSPLSLPLVGHHENGVLKAENGASPRTKKLKSP